MIRSISSTYSCCARFVQPKNFTKKHSEIDKQNYELINYDANKSLLAMNNISFKSSALNQKKVEPKSFVYKIESKSGIENPEIELV